MTVDLQPSPLTQGNFGFVRDFVARDAAIVIEPGKEYLVETRLANLAARQDCASVNALIDLVRAGGPAVAAIRSAIVEALTTNETLFFRDLAPFDALRDHLLPAFQAANPTTPFTVWSAASSTGQEAYSIAMLLAEHFPNLPASILGTDLSPAVIARARNGLYQQIEVNRGLPARLLMKYFRQQANGWQIDDRLRSRVTFREMNLIKPWPVMAPCHLLMLRNVMIYFELETRRQILRQVKNVLAPGGYLSLGGAETTVTLDPDFKPVQIGRATFYHL
ncbi:MAG: protein-glutamate O-methyltransferase CheR [Verrucomicrobia bacterium]|nr:protein-glutamate O-methyltransferase CheR [Verrucomicrobiota bacterium]